MKKTRHNYIGRLISSVTAAALALLMSHCKPNKQVWHSYKLVRGHSEFYSIVDDHGIEVIPANIELLGSSDGVIYGYLNPRKYVSYHMGDAAPKEGYFIFDMNFKTTHFALDKTSWEESLSRKGIFNPKLERTE